MSNGPGPSVVNQGPGPPAARPADPGPLLSAATDHAAALAQRLGAHIYDRLWRAAAVLDDCRAKVERYVQGALAEARRVSEEQGESVELDIYGALGAALEVAAAQGCAPPTAGEIAEMAARAASGPPPLGPLPPVRPAMMPSPPGFGGATMRPFMGSQMPELPPTPVFPEWLSGPRGRADWTGALPLEVAIVAPGQTGPATSPVETPYSPPAPPRPQPAPPARPPAPRPPVRPPTTRPTTGNGDFVAVPPVAPVPTTDGDFVPPAIAPVPQPTEPKPVPCIPICPPGTVPVVPPSPLPVPAPPTTTPPPGQPLGPGLAPFAPVLPPRPPGPVPPFVLPPLPIVGPGALPPAPPAPLPGDVTTIIVNAPTNFQYVTIITVNNVTYYTSGSVEPPDEPTPVQTLVPPPPVVAPPAPPGGAYLPPPPQMGFPTERGIPSPFDWNSPGACDALADYLALLDPVLQAVAGTEGGGSDPRLFGLTDSQVDSIVNDLPVPFRQLARWSLRQVGKLGGFISQFLSGLTGCQPNATLQLKVYQFGIEWLRKQFGGAFDTQARTAGYLVNSVCPSALPPQYDVDNAYLAHEIDRQLWECWTKALGNLPWPAERQMLAKRTRHNPLQATALYLRGAVGRGRWLRYLREFGVLTNRQAHEYEQLAAYVPPASDLVRFMVRDVFDADVVERFQYDAQFAEKFTGPARDWARAQGMGESQFRFYWRAHWRLPSPTQAFEMLQRNRPGRVPENEVTTRDDVKKLLEIDDLAPYWQDRLIATSYRVLRLVDIRRGYYNGAISEDELLQQLQDRGYTASNARLTADVFRRDRLRYFLSRPHARAFLQGVADEQETRDAYVAEGMSDAAWNELAPQLRQKRTIARRTLCIRAIRKRYLLGDLPGAEATELQIVNGLAPGAAAGNTSWWECERKVKGKTAPAATLCRWAQRGLLPRADFEARLLALGYGPSDVRRIVADCSLVAADRARAATASALRARAAEQERENRKREGAAKAAQASLAAAAREALKEKRRREKIDARAQQLAYLVQLVSGRSEAESDALVKEALDALVSRKGISDEGALDLLYDLVKGLKALKRKGVAAAIADLMEEYPDVLPGPPEATGRPQEATGGTGRG